MLKNSFIKSLIFPAVLFLISCAAPEVKQTFYGTEDLKTFRDGRDKEFRSKEETPLKEEDFPLFEGLNYFPTGERFRVKAKFTRAAAGERYFEMPTSAGKQKKFIKYGVLSFKIGDEDFALSAYQTDEESLKNYPEYADLLFIPFKDLTNSKETYGGGRYIDIKIPKGEEAILDFNLAYNPSCAYGSDRYNCPIPPAENHLRAEIKAGEKFFVSPGAAKEH